MLASKSDTETKSKVYEGDVRMVELFEVGKEKIVYGIVAGLVIGLGGGVWIGMRIKKRKE